MPGSPLNAVIKRKIARAALKSDQNTSAPVIESTDTTS